VLVSARASGPGHRPVASAPQGLRVDGFRRADPHSPWGNTYGVCGTRNWGQGLGHLLEHRWSNCISYFGIGCALAHQHDYAC